MSDLADAPWMSLPDAPFSQPNVPQGNATFSKVIANALSNPEAEVNKSFPHSNAAIVQQTMDEMRGIDPVRGSLEAMLNAATGLLTGFPAYMTGAIAGLTNKYLLNGQSDPKAIAEAWQNFFTFKPKTEAGENISGVLSYPLEKLGEGAKASGEWATRNALIQQPPGRGGSSGNPYAPAIGAITDATVQTLAPTLLAELSRKLAGQTVTSEDMQNTAKIIATDAGKPEAAPVVESSLQETYRQTGIGPYTVMQEAAGNPAVKADLLDTKAQVPSALWDYVSPEQREANFKAWFGDSKVVDTDGSPQVVYHGTNADFSQFKIQDRVSNAISTLLTSIASNFDDRYSTRGAKEKATAWFTSNPHLASDYAEGYRAGPDAGGPNVMPVYLSIERPIILDHETGSLLLPDGTEYKDFSLSRSNFYNNEHLIDMARKEGADGIIIKGGTDAANARFLNTPVDIYVALRPEQIKSAIGNSGRFNPKSASLTDPRPVLDVSGPTVDEMREVQGVNAGTVELNMGLNPSATLKAVADSYTPFVGVDQLEKPVLPEAERSGFVDSVQKLIAPASRGDAANMTAGIMRANLGEMARVREVALENLKETAASFDKLSPEENVRFIDSMERGTPDPRFSAEAGALRSLLDDRRDQVQALGKGQLENFDENYFPHMWKDEKSAAQVFSSRPLEGSKGFLKERTIPYTVDGMKWRAYDAEGDFVKSFNTEAEAKAAMPEGGRIGKPLTPITTNPVEMALLKVREMDRYIYGQKIFEEMKANDLARFVPFGGEAPEGWTKINDKIARVMQYSEDEKGMILRGEYYAPDEAATLINNHLSPGLQGNAFYDAFRAVGMAMNSLQLGLSAFHVGFTTLDAMTSRIALGVKQMSRGDVVEGAVNVAMGMTPAQPFINIYKGDKLLRAYLGKLDDPSIAPIVEAIQQAGGRVKMDDFYRNATVNEFKQALRTGRSWDAAKAFLPTVLDRMNVPVMEWLVPRQKLGVFFDMAKDWLDKNPDASIMERREGLGKLWDSVDNRMGQLVYDNLFWNRTMKDGLMATVRSVGWNLGTFREIGGGVADITKILSNKGLTDRTAYIVALPMLAATYGALTQWLYTGEGPSELKDLFFPKTGRIRPDGSEDRVSLPTYMKDVVAYAQDVSNFGKYGTDPTQTLKNKMHPAISTISEMLNNQDFYGATIRNPADPFVKQVMEEAEYLYHQIEPFSIRNYQQQAQLRGEDVANMTPGQKVLDYVTSPSMVGVTPAPGYLTKSKEELESEAISRLRDPLVRKFRQEIKDGKPIDEVVKEAIHSGLTRNDIRFMVRTSGETPPPKRLRSFKEEE